MKAKNKSKKLAAKVFMGFTIFQLILMAVILVSGLTIAYLSAMESRTNIFLTAGTDLEIEEPDVDNPDSVDWGEEAKKVKLTVTAPNVAVYGRLALVLSARDSKGNHHPFNFGGLSEPDSVTGQLVSGDFILHFNPDWQDNWFFKDGFFYYRHILRSGDETDLLLHGITLAFENEEEKAAYSKLRIHVDLLADSIQAGEAVPVWGVGLDTDRVSLIP